MSTLGPEHDVGKPRPGAQGGSHAGEDILGSAEDGTIPCLLYPYRGIETVGHALRELFDAQRGTGLASDEVDFEDRI